uniref:Glyoxylate reductase/hydroxypyruvate reductase n=1 Tax=Globodera rostochiensis TaxID=31243 RepID=A0A914GWQ6_GLORO
MAQKLSSKAKIVVTDSTVSLKKLAAVGDVFQYSGHGQMPREMLLEKVADADALFCLLRDKIDEELLERATKLKVVGTMSVGYEHIDLEACRKRGVRIGYTPDVLTDATAELGMALLLATARRIPEAVRSAQTGGWKTWSPYYMCGKTLVDAVIGVYGMGKIGTCMANKMVAFKPKRIIYNNRRPVDSSPFEFVSFDALLAQSDFVIVCAAPSKENAQIFNRDAFAKMKKDSILINISRGILVDIEALREALRDGRIRAAGLDVTDPEPLPTDHPLFSMDNCVILPHIGSATYATRDLMASTTEQNICNFFQGIEMVAELKFG